MRYQTTKEAPNFTIKEITETKGSGFVATRNIKAGEFICDDKPLIIDATTEGYMNAFNYIQNDADHSYLLDYLCYPKDLQYDTLFDRFKKQIELNMYQVYANPNNKQHSNNNDNNNSTKQLRLYPTFCKLNHSCFPNASLQIDFYDQINENSSSMNNNDKQKNSNIAQKLFAIRDINKDEEICVSFVPELFLPTYMRKALIEKKYYFKCECTRCNSDHIHDSNINDGNKVIEASLCGICDKDAANSVGFRQQLEAKCTEIMAFEDILLDMNFDKIDEMIETCEMFCSEYESKSLLSTHWFVYYVRKKLDLLYPYQRPFAKYKFLNNKLLTMAIEQKLFQLMNSYLTSIDNHNGKDTNANGNANEFYIGNLFASNYFDCCDIVHSLETSENKNQEKIDQIHQHLNKLFKTNFSVFKESALLLATKEGKDMYFGNTSKIVGL